MIKSLCYLLLPALIWLSGCATASTNRPQSYWTSQDCSAAPADSEINPVLAEDLRQFAAAMTKQLTSLLKHAAADPGNPEILKQLRHCQNSAEDEKAVIRDMVPASEYGVPLLIHRPAQPSQGLPIVIYLHGGGWCLGSATATGNIAKQLCLTIPAVVISADYSLAPERPFPSALDDIATILAHIGQLSGQYGADPDRLYLAGDSAGGNLAAAVALQSDLNIRGLILFYPALDLTDRQSPSWRRFGNGYGLDRILFDAFVDCYLPDHKERGQALASPLFGDMSHMPPTLLISGQFDPLRDDAARLATRMRKKGRPVRNLCLPGMTHAWLESPYLEQDCSNVMAEAAQFVRRTTSHTDK